MRFRLALALSISVLLIGTASWSRFVNTEKVQPNIVAVDQPEISSGEILSDFVEPKAVGTASGDTTLSNTDIIGRELILDYVNLATNGQATEASVTALADKYVSSIPTLNKATVISAADIKTVPNTKSNFQNYADALTTVYRKYGERVDETPGTGSDLNTLNPALYSLTSTLSTIYTETALKLKDLIVPASLVSIHLQLVNSYFSSAAAMGALSKTDEDSASAFAGLVTLNDNLNKENVLLNEIGQILTSNGI